MSDYPDHEIEGLPRDLQTPPEPEDPIAEAAAKIGTDHGESAATWANIDGYEGAARIIELDEDCELDAPAPPLGDTPAMDEDAENTLREIYETADIDLEEQGMDTPPPLTAEQSDRYRSAYVDAYTTAVVTRARDYLAGCPVPVYVRLDGDTINDDTDVDHVQAVLNEDRDHNAAMALGWANSASISLDPNEDSITVSISTGDPRGGFAFTIRRIPEGDHEYAGRLVMHVPDPSDGMLHEDLSELHHGTFLIGPKGGKR